MKAYSSSFFYLRSPVFGLRRNAVAGFSILVLLLGFTGGSSAQNVRQAASPATEKTNPKDARPQLFEKKKMLISILKKQESDWNSGDLKGFMAPYWNSDTLMTVTVRGVQYGKDRLEKYLNRTFPDSASMGQLQYNVIHIELIGESDALLTGKWLRKNEKKFRGGYFSILLRKLNSRWVIISEHMG